MTQSRSQFVQGEDDQGDELIDFGGLPCRRPVREAFKQHGMDSTEAMVVLEEWHGIGALVSQGVLTANGSISKGARAVAWESHDGWAIFTITNRKREPSRDSEPETYSLEWRVLEHEDGTQGAYVHSFWLGGAAQRPSSNVANPSGRT